MKALEKIINSKNIGIGKDGFYQFLKLESGDISKVREKLIFDFCEEIFKVKFIDFSISNDWVKFQDVYPREYQDMVKNCKGVIDLSKTNFGKIKNMYFPCNGEYSYVVRYRDDYSHPKNARELLHEISHLIISGIYSNELDYGYNSSTTERFLIKNGDNVIEVLAGSLTYVWWRFFGVLEDSNYNPIYEVYSLSTRDLKKGFIILKKLGILQEDNLPVIALFMNVYQLKDKYLSDL